MFCLVGDVSRYPFDLGRAHAEGSVTLLPREEVTLLSHQASRVALQSPHNILQSDIWRQRQENVYVVFYPSYRDHMNAVIACDGGEIIPQPGPQVGTNELPSFLGAEDDVEEGRDIAMGHVETLISDRERGG